MTVAESPAESVQPDVPKAAANESPNQSDPRRFSRKRHGHYDPRGGAAMYSPIVGTFGALSVSAIVVVFTVSPKNAPHSDLYLVLATGLLVVGMFGSLLGAIALGAISAEVKPTASTPAPGSLC